MTDHIAVQVVKIVMLQCRYLTHPPLGERPPGSSNGLAPLAAAPTAAPPIYRTVT